MKEIGKKLMNIGLGLGIAGLSLMPLKSNAQDNVIKARLGPAYTVIDTRYNSKRDFMGVEMRVEKDLTKRISLEGGLGFYDTFKEGDYSKMQINYGIKYKPIFFRGWNLGIKAAVGASSEFYKTPVEILRKIAENREIRSINEIIEIQLEKEFKLFGNNRHINIGASQEFGKNDALTFRMLYGGEINLN